MEGGHLGEIGRHFFPADQQVLLREMQEHEVEALAALLSLAVVTAQVEPCCTEHLNRRYTPEQVALYAAYARQIGWLNSAGSDSHTPKQPPIKYRAHPCAALLTGLDIRGYLMPPKCFESKVSISEMFVSSHNQKPLTTSR